MNLNPLLMITSFNNKTEIIIEITENENTSLTDFFEKQNNKGF